jgi:hypothetical protein
MPSDKIYSMKDYKVMSTKNKKLLMIQKIWFCCNEFYKLKRVIEIVGMINATFYILLKNAIH